jgi:hypothetical protein
MHAQTIQRLPTVFEIRKMSASDLKKTAQDLDNPMGGHGLARHSPDLPDKNLKERLLTGYIHNKFSPAPGLSTKWSDYKSYLICRVRAVEEIKKAYQNTWDKLGNLIAAHRTAEGNFAAQLLAGGGAAMGGLALARNQAWAALTTEANKLTLDCSTFYLPIVVNAGTYRIMLHQNYNMVNKHEDLASLGKGFKGQNENVIDHPEGTIDPITGVVKKETLYKKWVAIDYGLYQAATTFVTGGGELTAGLKPEDWMITRHYPDNRQPGWY